MIKRFKWCVGSTLVLTLQLALSPIATNAIAKTDAVEPNSSRNNSTSTLLRVSQSVSIEEATTGETINHELTAHNSSTTEVASNIRLFIKLPAGFKFKKGSVLLNSASSSDPIISVDGKAFIFKIGNLAANSSSTIRFTSLTTAESKPGKAVLYASAISSGGGTSNIAKSILTIKDEHQTSKESSIETQPVKTVPVTPPSIKKETVESLPEVISDTKPTLPVTAPDTIASKPAEPVNMPSTQSPEPLDLLPKTLPATENNNASNRFVIPESQKLSDLIGMSAISVLSDIDGQYVESMSKNQIFENENAKKVDELNILESIRAGRYFNRESLASLARKEQAKAQTGQAFALLLPSVSLRASYGSEISQPSVEVDSKGNSVSYSEHPRTDLSLTVRQPLLDIPTFIDWKRREATEKVRSENYRISDSDAYLSTLNSYLNLVSSRIQIDMTRDFETQLSELLTYIEKRTKAGAASISDLSRVKARNQATKSFRLEQEASHAAAGIEFVTLTNLVPKKLLLPALEDVDASLLPPSFDMAVTTAMSKNPEITSLTAELQAATMDKSSAKSRYFPRVDAEYTDSFALHAGGSANSNGQRDRRLMMVMNWNLFSGGSDYNYIIERTERYKELQYRLDDQRRRIVQTLSANYATLDTTRKRISAGYNELKAISTAAEAMSKRMLSGNQSLLDLLDVYDRYYQIRSRLVSLHVLEISTVAQLVRVTHGTPGTTPEIKAEPAKSK